MRIDREIGDEDGAGAGGASVGDEALVAVGFEQRLVDEGNERHLDAPANLRQAFQAGLRSHALGERPLGRVADDRPVGERIRERKAELDQVGAARYCRGGQLGRFAPGHQEDDEFLLHARLSSCASASSRSLSPRPDRQTTISDSSASSARARACDDSSAGMMPSVLVRRSKAASASSSVQGRYVTLPESRRAACSGPTPGSSSPAEREWAAAIGPPSSASTSERAPCKTARRPEPRLAAPAASTP